MPRRRREQTIYHPPRKIRGQKNYYICYSEGGRSKRLSTGTDNEQEAQRYYYQFIAGINAPAPPDTVYLQNALNEYYSTQGQLTSNPKKIKYRSKKLLEFFNDIPVLQITRSQCLQYAAMRREEGVTNSTIRRELGIMKAAINHVRKEGWIPFAPHIERPPEGKRRERYLTREECRKLIAGCESHHVKTFVVLALTTGARKSAILELTWDRVDLNNRVIDYNVPGEDRRKKGRAMPPINNLCLSVLLEAQQLAQTKYVIEYGGRPCRNMVTGFKKAVKRAGLGKDVTPHVLRHTFATLALQARSPIYEVSGVLGHKDTRTTIAQYGHHHPDYQREAVAALEDIA